jgi:hypothetical protein
MFTIKAIKGDGGRDVFAAVRYSIHENRESYEVTAEEPGKGERVSLYVSADRYHHIIIENAAGRNVDHLRVGHLRGQAKVIPEVDVTINGEKRKIIADAAATYEHLVDLAGMTGHPSMAIRFGDRGRKGKILAPGEAVELDNGAAVDVVHTGNA